MGGKYALQRNIDFSERVLIVIKGLQSTENKEINEHIHL